MVGPPLHKPDATSDGDALQPDATSDEAALHLDATSDGAYGVSPQTILIVKSFIC